MTFDELTERAYQELDDAADTAIVAIKGSEGNIKEVSNIEIDSSGRLVLIAESYNRVGSRIKP